jgi:Kdo2-lipid IVA lauroyltransferase/acyltransferase
VRRWRGAGFWLAERAVRALSRWPAPLRDALFGGLGALTWALAPRLRRRVGGRLTAGRSERARWVDTLAAFRTVGWLLSDTIALVDRDQTAASRMTCDPQSRMVFSDALAEGRGVVFITAHLGPWERMAAVLAEEGFPAAAVAALGSDARLDALFESWRRPRGVTTLHRDRTSELARARGELDEGRAVGFLIDLPSRRPGVRERLFGETRDVPRGPFRWAIERGHAVVVGTPAKRKDGSMEVNIERIRWDDLPGGRAGETLLRRRALDALDRRIQRWPEAWLGLFVAARPPSIGSNRSRAES